MHLIEQFQVAHLFLVKKLYHYNQEDKMFEGSLEILDESENIRKSLEPRQLGTQEIHPAADGLSSH